MATKNKTILDVITGISTVLAKKYDGALDDDGKRASIGLKRDDEVALADARFPRVADGFAATIVGDRLILTYHSEIKMTNVHDKKFESDIEDYLDKIVKFLKKEYKSLTKDALSLSPQGKPLIKVETMSRQRSWVVAKQEYKIGRVEMEDTGEGDREKAADAIRKWLDQSSIKKPKNVTIKDGANDKE